MTSNVVLRQKGELVVVVSKARGLPALAGRYHVTVQAGSMNQQKTDALNAPDDAINLPAGSTFTMEWPHKAQRAQKVTKATEVVICLWRCATAFCLADGSRLGHTSSPAVYGLTHRCSYTVPCVALLSWTLAIVKQATPLSFTPNARSPLPTWSTWCACLQLYTRLSFRSIGSLFTRHMTCHMIC